MDLDLQLRESTPEASYSPTIDDQRFNLVMQQPEERLNLAQKITSKIVTVGKQKAGKSSLIQTLLRGTSYLVEDENRTEVMDFVVLPLTKDDNALVYDLGGHSAYEDIAHFFFTNDQRAIVLLVHEYDGDLEKTQLWLKEVVLKAPLCTIIPIIAKIDLVERVEVRNSFCEEYCQSMDNFLEKEIKFLKINKKTMKLKLGDINTDENERDITTYELNVIDTVIHAYEKFKTNLKAKEQSKFPFMVSCKPLHLSTITMLREKIVNLIKGKHIEIPGIWQKIYSELTLESMTGNYLEPGIPANPLQTMTLKDVKDKFLLENHENEEHEAEEFLQIFSNLGLLLWFKGEPSLIFPNVIKFMELLKCLFSHRALEKDFDQLPLDIQELYDIEACGYKRDLDDLKYRGILKKNLLKVLLEPFKLDDKYHVIAGILQNLKLAFEISIEKHFLFPWYITQRDIPQTIAQDIKKMSISTKENLSLVCLFTGNVPKSLFYILCVQLLIYCRDKTYKHDFTNGVTLWQSGIYVTITGIDLTLQYSRCSTGSEMIEMFIRGEPKHLLQLWDIIKTVYEYIKSQRETCWPGYVTGCFLICPHCQIRNSHKDQWNVYDKCKRLSLKDQLNCRPLEWYTCDEEHTSRIPAALVTYPENIHFGDLDPEIEVQKYLKAVC